MTSNNRSIAIICLFVLLISLTVPVAGTTNATFTGLGSGEQIYSRYYSRNVPAQVFLMDVNGTQYQGFCIDLFTTISIGNVLLVNGPLSDDIRSQVDWCSVNYILNTYAGNYTVGRNTSERNREAASIQAAIWYLVTEPYGVYNGSGRYQFMSDNLLPTPYDGYRTSDPRDAVRNRAFQMISNARPTGNGSCTFKFPVRVELYPITANISPSGTQLLTAKVFDQDGNGLPGVRVNFSNAGPGPGSLAPQWNITIADGTTTVLFTAGPGTSHAHIDIWVEGNYGTLLYDAGRNKQSVTTITLLPYSIANRSSIFWTATPSIKLEKLISLDNHTWVHANESPGIRVLEGSDLYYKIVITNDGNVTLSPINLTDSLYTPCPPPSQLHPGQVFECFLGPFKAALGVNCNTATANGTYQGSIVESSDRACYDPEPTYNKSGRVFYDMKGDGIFDPSEDTPVANVTVWLCTQCETTLPANTLNISRTNATGHYEIRQLPEDDYNVTIPRFTSDPEDVNEYLFDQNIPVLTSRVKFNNTPLERVYISFHLDDDEYDNDFGFRPLGNISGYKFRDLAGDGFTADDLPLAAWNITLVNATDFSIVNFTQTLVNGSYFFTQVPAGNYFVNETLQYGWIKTFPSANNYSVTINASTRERSNLNFSNHQVLGTVTGIKFYDGNHDGVYNEDTEPVIPGWIIILNNSTLSRTTTTEPNGTYIFNDVDTDYIYTVRELLPPGWVNSTPMSTSINFTSTILCPGYFHLYDDALLLARMPNSRIFFVPESRNPAVSPDYEIDIHTVFAGFNVRAQSDFAWTNGAIYDFNVTYDAGTNSITYTVNNSTYSRMVSWNAGSTLMPVTDFAIRSVSNVPNCQIDVFDLAFTPEGSPTVAVPDSALGGTNTSWANLSAGRRMDIFWIRAGAITGVEDLTATGYTLTGKQRMQWVGPAPTRSNLHYTIKFGKPRCPVDNNRFVVFGNWQINNISGYKLQSPGNTPLVNWTINLTHENGTLAGTIYTNPAGFYRFDNLTSGNYSVSEILEPGWVQITPVEGFYNVTINETSVLYQNLNFTNMRPGCLSGYKINNTTKAGLPNWQITVNNTTGYTWQATTNDTGFWQVCGLPSGTYTINETLQNGWYRVSPSGNYSVNLSGSNVSGLNFTNSMRSGSITGIKFNDLNGNGTRDANDNPLSNWTINLYLNGKKVSSKTTKANGVYTFANLSWGTYVVNETRQSGWNQTAPPGGSYTVVIGPDSLNVSGRDFGNQQVYNRCTCPTRAYFTQAQVAPNSAHTIQFTDKSTGYPTDWLWKFGDGTTSDLKNPKKKYTKAGTYSVTLYVRVCGCSGQIYWTSYTRTITVL